MKMVNWLNAKSYRTRCVVCCLLLVNIFQIHCAFVFISFAVMLKISPGETITFQKTGNELLGTVDIINVVDYPITYKVNRSDFNRHPSHWSKLNWFFGFSFFFCLGISQIKTTSPEKFRVRPSTGVLAAGSSANINVVLQPGHNMTLLLNKDKFLVMCMELDDANITQQEIAELWKVSHS